MELFPQVFSGFTGELGILSNLEFFAKIVKNEKPFTIFVKISILDVWQGPEYACELASQVMDASFLNQFEYQR